MSVIPNEAVARERVAYHLEEALESNDVERKDYHIRTALQFCVTESDG